VGFKDWLSHAWNVFKTLDRPDPFETVANYGSRPDRVRLRFSNEKSIVSSIYTRMAIDVADIVFKHVRLDELGRFESEIDSGLNQCLNVSANTDQAPRAFRQDLAMSLFDQGVVAVVPVDTTLDPSVSGSFEIQTMRIGEIVRWSPKRVRVSLYNEETGKREEVTVEKKFVAIIENPLHAVMNETNSTLQRLIRKLNLLDVVDEQSSSGKLDMIIQLPYVTKSPAKQKMANDRRKEIEFQLRGSQYGIAYIDGTEKITQLNRPAENQLLKQVEYLTALLYSQLGLTQKVMDGTADESEMLNYHQRTIKPIVQSTVEAMRRAFLTKTARSQRQSILFFRDVFALVPVAQLAEFADAWTRNEIITANEMRGIVGLPPAKDANADKLINSNMPATKRGDPQTKAPDLSESGPPSQAANA
jgi:hypothetical protein